MKGPAALTAEVQALSKSPFCALKSSCVRPAESLYATARSTSMSNKNAVSVNEWKGCRWASPVQRSKGMERKKASKE
mgnify:CR=1 FL=1|jgi:hypothetical protein